jgi:uncharacterized protein YdeI (BOF family)
MTRLFTAASLALTLGAAAALADTITPIADASRGTIVTVQGVVDRITDEDEFRLVDASGKILVYVGPHWVPAAVGEMVIVHGFVDDDLGAREIYARSLTRADGEVIVFQPGYD